jgi:pimeloyl-ACP methyl ester carboxylesterase
LARPSGALPAWRDRIGPTARLRQRPSRPKPSSRPATRTTRRPTQRASRGAGIRSSSARLNRARTGRARALVALIGVLLVAGACATPIGISLTDPQEIHRLVTLSALNGDEPSGPTAQTLHRLGLGERFQKDPVGAIAALRGDGTGLGPDRLFALAELCFLYAEQTNRPDYYLASAVYAYAFLFRKDGAIDEPLDARTRLAADLYNFGLGLALTAPSAAAPSDDRPTAPGQTAAEAAASEIVLTERTLALPFGSLELRADKTDFTWGGLRMERFVSVGEFKIRGLRNRYRQPGIGVPLAAEVSQEGTGREAEIARQYIPKRVKVPTTAFVRLDNVMQAIADGQLRGQLELYPADEAATVEVEGRKLPLELEPSAVLAYALEGAPVWDTEYGFFLKPESRGSGMNLAMLHPYRQGRIPVVLIHGTASSPARWADMVNELTNDPVLRGHIQFWFFTYSTSNPILQSAAELRRALLEVVKQLDPDELDPALHRMVLIGHSQGGMLARLMVTDSGNRFWDRVSHVPFSEVKGPPESLAFVRDLIFFKPVPYVKRVVFIATPHRGSFRVSSIVLDLVRRIVTLPVRTVKTVNELATLNPDIAEAREAVKEMPTAIENMRPGNRFVRTYSASPIAPGVIAHSIIAVLGEGPVTGKTDGVVAYESAHLDGVASEKIVRAPHSCQGEPDTILEVRRILREHVANR